MSELSTAAAIHAGFSSVEQCLFFGGMSSDYNLLPHNCYDQDMTRTEVDLSEPLLSYNEIKPQSQCPTSFSVG